MYKSHKIVSFLVFFSSIVFAYLSEVKITEAISQNMVTFFSVVFGFYMTSLAILYSTRYAKKLHKEIDPKNNNQRKIHTLKNYFHLSGTWSIFSIISIICYMLKAKVDDGVLAIGLNPIIIFKAEINTDLVISSIILAISAVNIYLMFLLLNTILDGMIEEASM